MEDVEKLPITQYRGLVTQGINIGTFIGTGKLEPRDRAEKEAAMRAQIAELKARGLL